MRILIVEDEKELSNSICTYLKNDNFICDAVYDYYEAIQKVEKKEYACVILDISLPSGNGLDILKKLKEIGKADGVLIISAKNSLNDKVLGLNLGADDYLTKPFHLPELSARVASVIRRKYFQGQNSIIIGDIKINIDNKTVHGKNEMIDFTRKEYELLLFFVSNKNKVVTKEAIVEDLWGDQIDMADNYDFIYTHIKNLRKKIALAGCVDYIKAVHGVGYIFNTSLQEKTTKRK